MGGNGKRYVVLAASRETTTVTRARPVFRKIYCPHCGSDTHLFRRDDDDQPADRHTLLCEHHLGKLGDGSETAAPEDDQNSTATKAEQSTSAAARTGEE